MRFLFDEQELQDFEEFKESDEFDSEDELESLDDGEFIYTDMDQLSFENVDQDYFSIGYVDPSDFEY